MRQFIWIGILVPAILAGCASDRLPEEWTADGLVRVPSRASGGVYRAPGATFTQYQRIILEPPPVSFVKDWQDNHREVTAAEIARIRTESVELFRDEFAREFVERGPFEFADTPAPDVLLVVPAVEELDITATGAGAADMRIYTPGPVSFKVTGDLRDAATGKLVGRVITYQPKERYPFDELREANRTTNAREQRVVFARWSRLVHEALNVAKAERPRLPPTAAPQ